MILLFHLPLLSNQVQLLTSGIFLACAFSNPQNEAAWQASITQGQGGPFLQRLQELVSIEANLAKCPTVMKAAGKTTYNFAVSFRIPISQNLMRDPAGVCEYHFTSVVKGWWVEDEFIKALPTLPPEECVFGAPQSASFGVTSVTAYRKTLCAGKITRNFDFKYFKIHPQMYISLK